MKRNLTLLCLALALGLSLTACADSKAPTVTPSPSPSTGPSTSPMPTPSPSTTPEQSGGVTGRAGTAWDGETGLENGGRMGGGTASMPGVEGSVDWNGDDPYENGFLDGGMARSGHEMAEDGEYYADADGHVEDSHNATHGWGSHPFEDAANGVENAARDVIDGAGDAARDITEGVERSARDVSRGMQGVGRNAMDSTR